MPARRYGVTGWCGWLAPQGKEEWKEPLGSFRLSGPIERLDAILLHGNSGAERSQP